MPARRITRSRCNRGGAETTSTKSQRPVLRGFVQQRDVEHDQRLAAGAGGGDETALGVADLRMQDALETAQRFGVAEDLLAEALPVDAARLVAHARERRLDLAHRGPSPTQQAMDDRIGIE